MRIATWNIYWLGDRHGEHIVRSEDDEETIADVIANLAPDVLALQEIVDPFRLQHILDRASAAGRTYAIRTEDGVWLTSDSRPTEESNDFQKVFLCVNREAVEVVRLAAVRGGPGGRWLRSCAPARPGPSSPS